MGTIDGSVPFNALFCDVALYVMKLMKEKVGKRVYAFWVGRRWKPLRRRSAKLHRVETSQDALGRLVHGGMRGTMEWMVMRACRDMYNGVLATQGLAPSRGHYSMFPIEVRTWFSRVACQALRIRQPDPNQRSSSVARCYRTKRPSRAPSPNREADQYSAVILISQGTVDNKDPGKPIVPALEAL